MECMMRTCFDALGTFNNTRTTTADLICLINAPAAGLSRFQSAVNKPHSF